MPLRPALPLAILVAAFAPVTAPAASAQCVGGAGRAAGSSAFDTARLAREIPALMDSAGVPGLSIALIEGGRVSWVRGFGVRDTKSRLAVGERTVFEAASLSKPVFAYAVLKLVDEGKLDLDRPLADYWRYPDVSHDPRSRAITARMVLSHTTGFPNWRPRDGALTTLFEPGARFRYSGEGFVYLQKVVEHLTGEPMSAFVERTVFRPLGMSRSSFSWEARFDDDLAAGHAEDGTPRPKQRPSEGITAASLQTTARDFARFLLALSDGEGLRPATAKDMLDSQSSVADGVAWGLGVGLQKTERGVDFWQWGHNDGYRGYMLVGAETGTGFVVFMNGDSGMLLLEPLLALLSPGHQPAARWLDYERLDARRVRLALERTFLEEGSAVGIARYRALRAAGPTEAFVEDMLNNLGYALLRQGKKLEAIEVFKLNVEAYPEAYNTYDSLGEAYMENGQKDLAIANYEKSVALNPDNANGIEMLKKLREK